MTFFRSHKAFYLSITTGIVIWALSFLILPLTPVENIKFETIIYIVSGYLAIVLGFMSLNVKIKNTKKQQFDLSKYIIILLIIIVLSFVFRWIDLFYLRELSFNNAPKVNRLLNNNNYGKSQIIFLMASIFKSIYFFPIVLILSSKIKQKSIIHIASYVVLLFPIVEAILKGTRKPFFEMFLILLLALVIYQRHRINFKRIILSIFGIIVLMTISMMVLMKRETKLSRDQDFFYTKLLESRYNDLLAPSSRTVDFFKSSETPEIVKFYAMTVLHTGQYISHGVFEFNHIVSFKDLPITYGKYTFMTFPKFINNTGVFDQIEMINPSPRQFVYLTFFGAMYIDFRWAALPFMFLFGAIQKYVFLKEKQYVIYTPILIYFLIINVFLLIINYIGAAGIYPFFGFCFFLIVLQLLQFISYEKSSST